MTWKFYGCSLTPELIYLIEALKVEGYWSLKNREAIIQNKNLPFLVHLENSLKKLGLKVKKRLYLKIKLPTPSVKNKNISLLSGSKQLKFRLETSPFDGSKKVVTMLPYKSSYNLKLIYKNQDFPILLTKTSEEFKLKSNLKCFAYLELRFNAIEFIRFLEKYVSGKRKSDDIRVEPFLFAVKSDFMTAALSALIDAEGTLDYYGHTRRIRIRMNNKQYLMDWKKLLEKYSISTHLAKDKNLHCLVISGWEDFNKLYELGLNLKHSKKKSKWKEILHSYQTKQVSRGGALDFYLAKLKNSSKPLSAREFAEIIKKNKRTVNHYLLKLEQAGLINVKKSNFKYLYSAK